MSEDEKWMNYAIKEALKAEKNGEIPVGAVLVKDGNLIAKAHNQSIQNFDATAHAEIQLIRLAGKATQNYRLTGSSLYVTLEPCIMCFGAIVHARIEKLIFGAKDPKFGLSESTLNLDCKKKLNHKVEIRSGILEKNCSDILSSFFKSKR
tara:strand:- start:349 stop:798 length:450 start_codon:yes stop_codon:yes gene_type:complete